MSLAEALKRGKVAIMRTPRNNNLTTVYYATTMTVLKETYDMEGRTVESGRITYHDFAQTGLPLDGWRPMGMNE